MIVVALVLAACGGGAPTEEATSAPATDGSAAPATDPPAATDADPTVPPEAQGDVAQSVEAGELVPPVVAEPATGDPPFAGQTVTVIVNTAGEKGPISGPLYEVREEFEAATGATLEIVETPFEQHFPKLIQDMATGTGTYDVSIAGAWWLGELVSGDFVLPYDDYFADPRFPQWDYDAVLEGPRSLLEYQGRRYMVANDHDGQVLYYRRDVLEDPEWQEQFQAEYNYALPVPPRTWEEFRDVAAFFNGKDYNRNGTPGSGLTMHLKVGGQGMFHFMSMSAPYLVSPEQNLYWFDPADMTPLINSPGHVAALTQLVELVQYGPEAMLGWSLGESWDYFLRGNAVLTFTWGDLGALAQQEGSQVKGKIGAGPMPGTNQWYNLQTEAWVDVDTPNVVGNTTGGSWAGVISTFSDAPEASYYLLALMATNEKSAVYAQRGWDGVDPGRAFHFLPPNGSADVAGYEAAGWDTTDAEQYTNAYYEVFGNAVQLPYLRIPGTFEYWTALDVNLSQAATGQITAEDALQATFDEWQSITDRLGREEQLQSYRESLGLGN
jgi:multiple sugar transport system substrate-binding protein